MDMPPYLPNFSNEIQPPFGIQESEEDSPRTCIWAEPQPFLDVSRNQKKQQKAAGRSCLVCWVFSGWFGASLETSLVLSSGVVQGSRTVHLLTFGQLLGIWRQRALCRRRWLALSRWQLALCLCVCTHPSSTGHGWLHMFIQKSASLPACLVDLACS